MHNAISNLLSFRIRYCTEQESRGSQSGSESLLLKRKLWWSLSFYPLSTLAFCPCCACTVQYSEPRESVCEKEDDWWSFPSAETRNRKDTPIPGTRYHVRASIERAVPRRFRSWWRANDEGRMRFRLPENATWRRCCRGAAGRMGRKPAPPDLSRNRSREMAAAMSPSSPLETINNCQMLGLISQSWSSCGWNVFPSFPCQVVAVAMASFGTLVADSSSGWPVAIAACKLSLSLSKQRTLAPCGGGADPRLAPTSPVVTFIWMASLV